MNTPALMLQSIALATAVLTIQPIAGEQAPMHTETRFDVIVRLPLAKTMPLFGPEGERAWAGKHWDPKFIYPMPARDQEGAVFTISHGPVTAVWQVTRFDQAQRHFQYAYVIPGIMTAKIDVQFEPADAQTTRVHVAYERTALSEEGRDHVTAMTEGDRRAGKEWQEAIDAYLASQHNPSGN